jgi:hypothetical protein
VPKDPDRSAFDQAYVASARALLGVFNLELDSLPFAQQLEHGTADRAAMKEVLNAAFISNKPEPFVYQQSCNRPGWHTADPSDG